MRRLVKTPYETDWEDFREACIAENEKAFTLDGRDYMVCALAPYPDGPSDWFLCDALDYCTKRDAERLTDSYASFDTLASATLFNGGSMRDRFEDMELFHVFKLTGD